MGLRFIRCTVVRNSALRKRFSSQRFLVRGFNLPGFTAKDYMEGGLNEYWGKFGQFREVDFLESGSVSDSI